MRDRGFQLVGVAFIALFFCVFAFCLADTLLQYYVLREMPFKEGDFEALVITNMTGIAICVGLLVLNSLIQRSNIVSSNTDGD